MVAERWITKRTAVAVPLVVAVGSILLGLFSLKFALVVPTLVVGERFTGTSNIINTVGGLLYLSASASFLFKYLRTGKPEDILFLNFSLLLGVTGILFQFSSVWSPSWWIWHTLNMLVYLLALVFVFLVYDRIERKTGALLAELEARVEKRTAELAEAYEKLQQEVGQRELAEEKTKAGTRAVVIDIR